MARTAGSNKRRDGQQREDVMKVATTPGACLYLRCKKWQRKDATTISASPTIMRK